MRKYSKIGDILDKKDNDQKKPVAKKIIRSEEHTSELQSR